MLILRGDQMRSCVDGEHVEVFSSSKEWAFTFGEPVPLRVVPVRVISPDDDLIEIIADMENIHHGSGHPLVIVSSDPPA